MTTDDDIRTDRESNQCRTDGSPAKLPGEEEGHLPKGTGRVVLLSDGGCSLYLPVAYCQTCHLLTQVLLLLAHQLWVLIMDEIVHI